MPTVVRLGCSRDKKEEDGEIDTAQNNSCCCVIISYVRLSALPNPLKSYNTIHATSSLSRNQQRQRKTLCKKRSTYREKKNHLLRKKEENNWKHRKTRRYIVSKETESNHIELCNERGNHVAMMWNCSFIRQWRICASVNVFIHGRQMRLISVTIFDVSYQTWATD